MTTPVSTPYAVVRNASDSGSFFQSQQEAPTDNTLIIQQVDPTAPQTKGLKRISDPISPTHNAQQYVKNFDPEIYDLRDSSHLMRLIRALCSASGVGGLRKQTTVARLVSMLSGASFFDLDSFYGAIFGLPRHTAEAMPANLDGTTVNPYTDLADSDIWDQVASADARFRSRLFLLARAINMGGTYYGLKAAAEAVTGVEVDIAESWVSVDYKNNNKGLVTQTAQTYQSIRSQYVTYQNLHMHSYGELNGYQYGNGSLPFGNRGEVVFTPRSPISYEDSYQLQRVLNTLKPANVQATISTNQVESVTTLTPRNFSADSENWQIQSRVTPAIGLVQPTTDIYQNAGPYSLARPVFSEYSGERWTYNTNVVTTNSYRYQGENQVAPTDDQVIVYSDSTQHQYVSSDALRDLSQSLSQRLSGEGVVTNMPYVTDRSAK